MNAKIHQIISPSSNAEEIGAKSAEKHGLLASRLAAFSLHSKSIFTEGMTGWGA